MKCPHCGYIQGSDWDGDDYAYHEGDEGPFWELAIKLERNVGRDYHDNGDRKADVHGCPACKKLFLQEDHLF